MKGNDCFDLHDSSDTGVYLVEVCDGKSVRFGVFSKIDNARSWMEKWPPKFSCVCVPFFLDKPEEGGIQ